MIYSIILTSILHSFNLAEIIRELTKMSDESVTKLKEFSAYVMKIFPLSRLRNEKEKFITKN